MEINRGSAQKKTIRRRGEAIQYDILTLACLTSHRSKLWPQEKKKGVLCKL